MSDFKKIPKCPATNPRVNKIQLLLLPSSPPVLFCTGQHAPSPPGAAAPWRLPPPPAARGAGPPPFLPMGGARPRLRRVAPVLASSRRVGAPHRFFRQKGISAYSPFPRSPPCPFRHQSPKLRPFLIGSRKEFSFFFCDCCFLVYALQSV